ncbi:hypothetical protein OAF34_05530 [Pirellulaceae bacterium]|jgi:hypothetical protein|nr:hypothetical protein [Pirellulaceae bacterium]
MSVDNELKRQILSLAANLGIVRDSDPWAFVLNQISLHFSVRHSWDLSRISRMPLQNLLDLMQGEDPTNEIINPNHDVYFSSDFSVVVWQGQQHFFNRTQAQVVELLYHESKKGTVGLHQDSIGQKLQSCNNRFRLFHVFRNKNGKMHSLWNVMIVRVEPGIYALRLNSNEAGMTNQVLSETVAGI